MFSFSQGYLEPIIRNPYWCPWALWVHFECSMAVGWQFFLSFFLKIQCSIVASSFRNAHILIERLATLVAYIVCVYSEDLLGCLIKEAYIPISVMMVVEFQIVVGSIQYKVWVKKPRHVQKLTISKGSTILVLFLWNLAKMINS